MDYNEEQVLKTTLKEINEETHKLRQLVEAVARRHAEQDASRAALIYRIERLEKILKVEVKEADKKVIMESIGLPVRPRTIVNRLLGR